MTLREALVTSQSTLAPTSTTPWHDAEQVVGLALGVSREALMCATLEERMPVSAHRRLKAFLHKRSSGIPLPYLTGESFFYGWPFEVSPAVLIPRQESELLVEQALQCILRTALRSTPLVICDVGTGSGCIAISVARELAQFSPSPSVHIVASDISSSALRIAKKNAYMHGVARGIAFVQGDLLQPLKVAPQLIMANLPYLTPQQVAENPALHYEPQGALVAGPDGFLVYRRLLQDVHKVGWQGVTMLFEIDPAQKQLCEEEVKLRWPHASIDFVPDIHGFTRVARIAI